MRKRAPLLPNSDASIRAADLLPLTDGWIDDCEIREHSQRTLDTRRDVLTKLSWFLEKKGHETCGTPEVRGFLAYLVRGHKEPGGRWGNPQMTKEVRPSTTVSYYNILRTFFAFLVEQGDLEQSPMETLRPPINRQDQVRPFTAEQIDALLAVARKSVHPRRDEALVYFLWDTGTRASEVCGLAVADVDLNAKRCTVHGKGQKDRTIPFGRRARTALWAYLREDPKEASQPLFTSDRGHTPGEALTRSGVGQIVRRLGREAGIKGVRCSPHTLRHTFAVDFLRGGGNVFSLQALLGHESLEMVRKYVRLAEADVETQHRQFSPADRSKRKR